MLIQMTERHIQEGLRTHPCECPVAKAIKDATGLEAIVSPADVMLNVGGNRTVCYVWPREIKQWIRHFDAWGGLPIGIIPRLEPIAFELRRYE